MKNFFSDVHDNFLVPPGSYFFVLIGIVIVVFVIAFIVSKLWSGIFWYYRFRERNREMEQLAKEFNLSFQSGLSSLVSFILTSIFHDIKINELQGSIQNHRIEIQDRFYSLTTLITWIAPRSLGGGNRQTIVMVDGQEEKGNLGDFSLGNPLMLTTIDELRGFLKARAGSG